MIDGIVCDWTNRVPWSFVVTMSSLCTTVLGKYPREPVALKAENVSGFALEAAAIQTTLCEREPSSCHVFAGKKKSSFQILIETIPSLNVRSLGAARAWIISWVTSIVHVLGHRWTLRIWSLFNRKRKKKKNFISQHKCSKTCQN